MEVKNNARSKASAKYSKLNCKRFKIDCNIKTDDDIINHLLNLKIPKETYLKFLIREDIKKIEKK